MGMVGGQVFDIQAENKDIDLSTLQNIHKHKTGMLIRARRMGACRRRGSPTGRPYVMLRMSAWSFRSRTMCSPHGTR
jgi:hypothetical protein